MIRLTDYQTGEPVFIRPAAIASIVQLTAKEYSVAGPFTPKTLTRRTRITDTNGMILVVTEDATEIMRAIAAGTERADVAVTIDAVDTNDGRR